MRTTFEADDLRLSMSLGVATYPADGADAGEIMRAADDALHRAKQLGRNRVCDPQDCDASLPQATILSGASPAAF